MYNNIGDNMKSKIKKIIMPITLAVFCGFLCGRLMFSIYEEKGTTTLNSNIVYLLEDTTYNNYDDMKANTISANYIYYEDNGKYNVVVALTKNYDNITKIEKVYNKELKVSKYLINDKGLVTTLEEYDKKLNNSNDNKTKTSFDASYFNSDEDNKDD